MTAAGSYQSVADFLPWKWLEVLQSYIAAKKT
nr:MAG TPA: hypothetical protein [Caudoviricetes sp.]DAI00669.1 MAG TPA: hypothetical protein [Caudoviricetes sp.]DAW92353.1 MAG TPA: hypothetical protein [Bacteriophage sp.]